VIAEASMQQTGIRPPAGDPAVRAAILAALALYLEDARHPLSSPWAAAARAELCGAESPWQTGHDAWARAERPR